MKMCDSHNIQIELNLSSKCAIPTTVKFNSIRLRFDLINDVGFPQQEPGRQIEVRAKLQACIEQGWILNFK